jgi:3-phosphoshikimate 1-carboxyvinyltransferase
VAAALAGGRSRIENPLLSDDSRALIGALNTVGIEARVTGPAPEGGSEAAAAVDVIGHGGAIPAKRAELQVGNAGTTMRFLTALLALGGGTYVIDGSERMRQRPIEDLLVALRTLGARAEAVHDDGCPPVRVGGGIPGGAARLEGSRSSQYLSAILLAAPAAAETVDLTVEGGLVSRPYVDLTLDTMDRFSVRVERRPPGQEALRFIVPHGQKYRAHQLRIEGDFTSPRPPTSSPPPP